MISLAYLDVAKCLPNPLNQSFPYLRGLQELPPYPNNDPHIKMRKIIPILNINAPCQKLKKKILCGARFQN